jgi:hypothetical protein
VNEAVTIIHLYVKSDPTHYDLEKD